MTIASRNRGVAAFDASVLAPEDSSGDVIQMRILVRRWWMGALALLIVGCAAQNGGGGSLRTGMTTDQAVEAMGQPDLKDNVPDPNHTSSAMLRYTWLEPGEAAVLGPDMRVASIINVGSSPSTLSETAQQQQMRPQFDPIQTP